MKRLVIAVLCVLFLIAALNITTTTRQGVNYDIRYVKMPLYLKIFDFMDRHYNYVNIAKHITEGVRGEEEQALKILEWTHKNLRPLPKGMPVMDDHILYIIIRGYAVPEQYQDVFTTLCSYRGLPAFFLRIDSDDHSMRYALSFIKIKGKWRVFDAYSQKYFRTAKGDIASIEDFANDKKLLARVEDYSDEYEGIPYKEFYKNSCKVAPGDTARVSGQMPLKRIVMEMKKAVGL